MPLAAPFPSPQANNTQPPSNALYPALYLYPLNDTWAPKHITLSNQHTKIGRQTSSKTAPGERNGFFDSKVLSRQHAEVWEENGKIYIKDVRSSNGTFINGERLSSEGQESEPFELKSDDIVEFGIDIVGEDNKTIIHHKVAARVVCVFNEQDAQVAARAEQHQQQQHIQQQQYLQQSSAPGTSSLTSAGGTTSGIIGASATGPQNFPFAAQRRAQLAQQGLGGMGAIRPPGKTGLSFDLILSRLQGELQKSRETGAELTSLAGSMNEIHDTLGGNLPANLPPLPSSLPPIRPSQEAAPSNLNATSSLSPSAHCAGDHSTSFSSEQSSTHSTSNNIPSAVQDLQVQLRDTQSSLASYLDKVRAIEGVLGEQESTRREVRALREMMEERRREMEMERAQVEERIRREVEEVQRGRSFERGDGQDRGQRQGGLEQEEFDLEDDEIGLLDEDDDTRSIVTAMPHELERVDEEDEDQFVNDQHEQFDEPKLVQPLEDDALKFVDQDLSSSCDETMEEEEQRREDLNVGRPRTPEPSRLGLLAPVRRSTLSSPLSHIPTSELRSTPTNDVHEQVEKLSKQLSTVIQLTSALEAQHSAAQVTIKGLEGKVEALEEVLKTTEEALVKVQAANKELKPTVKEKVDNLEGKHFNSLVEMMVEWKKSVEGQWSSVREEWTQERERLAQARDDFEFKLRHVDSGLEKIASLQTTISSQQQQIQAQVQQQQQQLSALNNTTHVPSHPFLHVNGDALKYNGGLVTPPSPRSQSSDSGRYRRRRRRSSGSRSFRVRSLSGERVRIDGVDYDADEVAEEGAEMDVTLASSTEDHLESKARIIAFTESTATHGSASGPTTLQAGTQLATPASSVGSLEADVNPSNVKMRSTGGEMSMSSTHRDFEDMNSCGPDPSPLEGSPYVTPTVNVQTAVGVVLLSVAAAAVFWKVKPE